MKSNTFDIPPSSDHRIKEAHGHITHLKNQFIAVSMSKHTHSLKGKRDKINIDF